MARTVVTYNAGTWDVAGAPITTNPETITDATLSTSDITTNDVSTTKHGFAPKAPNDSTKFLNGTGAYSLPGVTGGTPATSAGVLLYDYVVTGSDKASIDTQVDDGGNGAAALPTGYHVLEIWFYGRTDEAVVASQTNWTFNNDSTASYDWVRVTGSNVTASANNAIGSTSFPAAMTGDSATANVFAVVRMTVFNYGGTVGFKSGEYIDTKQTQVAGSMEINARGMTYRSTTAISRVGVVVNTAAKKLKVGTRLTIWAR